jgi:hypothetical protein
VFIGVNLLSVARASNAGFFFGKILQSVPNRLGPDGGVGLDLLAKIAASRSSLFAV